jgi:hypothetical protein
MRVLTTLLFLAFCLNSEAYSRKANITLAPGGIGIHALKPSPQETIDLMPRKIDKNGFLVETPGFVFSYRYLDTQYGAMLLQDSFGHPAVGLAAGMTWAGSPNFIYGFVGGVYVRESVEKCQTLPTGRRICITKSKDIPLKFHTGSGDSKKDIAPILALTANYFIPITRNFQIDIGLISAFYISLLSVGFRFPI